MSDDSIRAGDLIEVRSRDEILSTLDPQGCLDGMPFMPEMLAFCGRRLRVQSVAHKTCDTVHQTGGRSIRDAVHLEGTRCDGSAHDGCQAGCLIFWKTAWLKPPGGTTAPAKKTSGPVVDERRIEDCTVVRGPTGEIQRYRCQATQLHDYSKLLRWWDVRQYWRDIQSRNATSREVGVTLLLAMVFQLRRLPFGYSLTRGLYDSLHRKFRGEPAPHGGGLIAQGARTPDERLGLEPGEWVQVKPRDEILKTVTVGRRNRGLSFDPEMVPYCGKRYRVAARISKIIHERTGEMMQFGNPCIVLDGVVCRSRYSHRRLMCPRQITPYWREIWLSREKEVEKA